MYCRTLVGAEEKVTGEANKITIKNSEGHLSKEDIQHMFQDDAKYEGEDDAGHEKIERRNSLETYCYTLRNIVSEEKVKDKISDA